MSWRNHPHPDAAPVLPIDYYPGSRHTARGVSRILRGLYHANDYFGSYLGGFGLTYSVHPEGTGGGPEQLLNTAIGDTISAVMCRIPVGLSRIRMAFLLGVAQQADVEALGEWRASLRLAVDGSVAGSATGDTEVFPAPQTEADGRFVSPAQLLGYARGGSARPYHQLADLAFGYVAGVLDLDVSAVDWSSSAGIAVQLEGWAYDGVPAPLYVLPYLGMVYGQIARRA